MQVILVDSESPRSLGIGRHMQLDVRVGDERLGEVDPRGISVNGERTLDRVNYRSTRIISFRTLLQLPSQPTIRSKGVPCSSSTPPEGFLELCSSSPFDPPPTAPSSCSCPGTLDARCSACAPYATLRLKSIRESFALNLVLIVSGRASTRR